MRKKYFMKRFLDTGILEIYRYLKEKHWALKKGNRREKKKIGETKVIF